MIKLNRWDGQVNSDYRNKYNDNVQKIEDGLNGLADLRETVNEEQKHVDDSINNFQAQLDKFKQDFDKTNQKNSDRVDRIVLGKDPEAIEKVLIPILKGYGVI